MRKIIDLSTPVVEGHFRWPVERKLLKSYAAGDPNQATWAGWNLHAFTHMDSPRHVDPDGFTTDGISLDTVVGEAAVVDVSFVEAESPVTGEAMEAAGGHVRSGDIVLMKSAWDTRASIDTPDYWLHAPYMTAEAAIWLRERGIKAIGFDFPQDYCIRYFLTGQPRPPLEEHVTHYHLLKRGIIMIEYLCNLSALTGSRTFVAALPVKVPNSDGAPTRVVAIEDDAA